MPSITLLRRLYPITSLPDHITWVGEARDRSIRIAVGPLRAHSTSYTQRNESWGTRTQSGRRLSCATWPPQVEVTYDIDGHDILNVRARDKAAGQAQRIGMTAGTKLSELEVERLVKDAEHCAAAVAGLAVSHLTVADMWKR